jgi:hypothetical protein
MPVLPGVIVVLWRAGLRISEALALNETHLDRDRDALLIRHGKRDKRREVGIDRWGWSHLEPWLQLRTTLPVGRLFCVLRGPTRGRPCAPAAIRVQLHHAAARGLSVGIAPGSRCSSSRNSSSRNAWWYRYDSARPSSGTTSKLDRRSDSSIAALPVRSSTGSHSCPHIRSSTAVHVRNLSSSAFNAKGPRTVVIGDVTVLRTDRRHRFAVNRASLTQG